MDYKKKYEETIKRAKEQLDGAKAFNYDNEQIAHDIRTTVYNILPELKESNDEKMWKLIKKYAHYNISDLALEADHITREYLESWLEKQKDANEEYWQGYREGKQEILDKYAELEQQEEQSLNIIWHDVSEEPEARGEIFCEWKSSTDTWHSIVFYLPNSKTFCEGERIVKNVLRWAYVDEMLEKQGEYKFADKPNKVDPIFHEGDWITIK